MLRLERCAYVLLLLLTAPAVPAQTIQPASDSAGARTDGDPKFRTRFAAATLEDRAG
jgi:hypothetical protein